MPEFVHSPNDGHLDSFQFLAVTDKATVSSSYDRAAMNIVCVCLCVCVCAFKNYFIFYFYY